ncbi:hypothetical protein [Burkholderia multivorans]|uniref:hypothetical protein n=1 Tax=Burkholderia multivorans TaxID=87883 RepID=UPI000B2EED82|nr:hypothetical protein [Burkholderia multivorans]MCA8385371.1 hypothetical protein [Burkholderia multivorans]
MKLAYRIHEWLADHVSWIQYPQPRIRSLSGHAHGWRVRWQTRPPMNRALALFLPTAMLFFPKIGVFLAIAAVIFLFVYFKR